MKKIITEVVLVLPLYLILLFIWWRFRPLIKAMADVGDILNDDKSFLQAEGGIRSMDPPPKEDVRDHDVFISLTGVLYVTVNSRKGKGKAFKKHILKDIVTRGFDARIITSRHHYPS